MKRFHVHVSVENLASSIAFYNALFGQPAKQQADYAKWMLDDPRVNFAISQRGHKLGVNHLGLQVESDDELSQIKQRAVTAAASVQSQVIDQGSASCCYAKSQKHWVLDPQGIAWEGYFTMADAQTYGGDTMSKEPKGATVEQACCIPLSAQS
jgi:predicted enzyme related to lactoylglutathione lyase